MGTTTISSWSNDTSDELEATAHAIADVIPRDTNTSSERYIIFTANERPELPDATRDRIRELGFEVRDMRDHAIDYVKKDTRARATFLAH